ncbi:unnamed protein product (macronuclear) [Paramecium tetraurelia]|uniref:Uncharacterized protein n=1 Tax=Paramecium tetraurelia TaxID=5888 RepID=A0EB52_PARTE|nr:uncharacterized protein GSPATT00025253001 [Paramecium tetraurelia]CAK92519.1 unnamed protein product [Paramecium tetraurelia]|eukprot:XP_001459916.1 hypothetical protein (macronuclear) [Paramecium tetraurelia strain d4-2]
MNQKEQINPFKAYGTKEVWEKINESGKNKEYVRFPGIGIEQTPFYQMQRQHAEKNQSKKQDFLSKLNKFEYFPSGNQKKLDIQGMFSQIDDVKKYQARMERIDPINKNLLQHKLHKALETASFLWGEQFRHDGSLGTLDSINNLLNQSQKKLEQRNQRSSQGKAWTRNMNINQYVFLSALVPTK